MSALAIGLIVVALAIGIAIGKALADEGLQRKARIASELAYKTAVALEKAEHDLWVMDGQP